MRFLSIFLIFLLPIAVSAQQRDSYFDNYGAYQKFVDSHIENRNFIELIQVLGGRDEYTIEQLEGIQKQFLTIYESDFTNHAVTHQVDLGGGFRQEMRIYWSEDDSYTYFYAMLHDRGNELLVLKFTMNSDVSKVLANF